VRDIYAVGDDRVLLVTTDLHQRVRRGDGGNHPDEGCSADANLGVLVSTSWKGVVPHHMMSADVDEIIDELPTLK